MMAEQTDPIAQKIAEAQVQRWAEQRAEQTVDYAVRCDHCGKMILVGMLTRPWRLECPRCHKQSGRE